MRQSVQPEPSIEMYFRSWVFFWTSLSLSSTRASGSVAAMARSHSSRSTIDAVCGVSARCLGIQTSMRREFSAYATGNEVRNEPARSRPDATLLESPGGGLKTPAAVPAPMAAIAVGEPADLFLASKV